MGTALETEFRASMQAIIASSIALDSFYAAVKERIEIPSKVCAAWKAKGTARWEQMAEVFRRAFRLKDDAANGLRANLEDPDLPFLDTDDFCARTGTETGAPILP